MQRKNDHPLDLRPGFNQEEHRPPKGERWIELLRTLLPIGRLVIPAAPADPVRGLGLPGPDVPEDPAMISAYYLSFYE